MITSGGISQSALGVMAKYWTPGQVKTRLGATIGMDPAASLHRHFTLHLCKNLARFADVRELCLTPQRRLADATAALRAVDLADRWPVTPQGAGDLGQRISGWMARHLKADDCCAILIGADCPTLLPADLDAALVLLGQHDLVLGPAEDGGYYLIGLRGSWDDRRASLFGGIRWSQSDVFQTTLARAAAAGLSQASLLVDADVDTFADLTRLVERLQADELAVHQPLSRFVQQTLSVAIGDGTS